MARPGGYRWNPTLKRYIGPNGRMVSQAQVRSALDQAIRAADGRARALASQLRGGSISLASWEREMRQLVKDVELYGASAASGGWAQLGQSQLGRVGSLVREQYERLHSFAADIASGKQKLDGALTNRAVMYAKQGRRAYYKQMDVEMADAGYDEERNVRARGDNCDGCIDATAVGWVAIGTLPAVGERDCLSHCRCRIEYRRSRTGERENPRPPRRIRRRR